MLRPGRFIFAVLLAMPLAACGQRWSFPNAHNADDGVQSVPDKIVLALKDVVTTGYEAGSPTACTVVYSASNSTSADLRAADIALGDYGFSISPLPHQTAYSSDELLNAAPISGSCAGVVEALLRGVQDPAVEACSLSSGDCQSRIAVLSNLDRESETEIRRSEQVASRQYALEQVQRFQKARAQAWAQRGRYQLALGAALESSSPTAPISLPAVTDPNFDPSRNPAPGSAMAAVTFCPPDPNAKPVGVPANGAAASPVTPTPPPGRLIAVNANRDQFGLAVWYGFKLVCTGHPDHSVWMRASAIEDNLRSGRLRSVSG